MMVHARTLHTDIGGDFPKTKTVVARCPNSKIPGIKEQAAQVIISEVGLDMTKWNTEKQFSSFLGLCPDNSISGGKVLHRTTRKVYNRAADTLRLVPKASPTARARWEPNIAA